MFQTELSCWADVLDRFDDMLRDACAKEAEDSWVLRCDTPDNEGVREMQMQTLGFLFLQFVMY